MVAVASRASWGARYRDGDITLSGLANEVFLHHTVTAQLSANATVAQEQAQMRNIEAIGQSRFKYGISYNVIIFPSGRAYQGVSWNRRGAHTGGLNSTSRSICFAGNYETNRPTEAQLQTAGAILREGRNKWWTKNAPLRSHRDVAQTACPGRHVHGARAYILTLSQQENNMTDPRAVWTFRNENLEKRDAYGVLRAAANMMAQRLSANPATGNPSTVGELIAIGGRYTYFNWEMLRELKVQNAQILAAVAAGQNISAEDIADALLPALIEPLVAGIGTELGMTVEQVQVAIDRALSELTITRA